MRRFIGIECVLLKMADEVEKQADDEFICAACASAFRLLAKNATKNLDAWGKSRVKSALKKLAKVEKKRGAVK